MFKKQIFLALALCALLTPSLEAMGWGKTNQTETYQGNVWTEVYMDLDGLYLDAFMPNYKTSMLTGVEVRLEGIVGGAGYVITTTFNQGFDARKSEKDWFNEIKKMNKDFTTTPVPGKKWTWDLVPKTKSFKAYWRFFVTEDRLIKAGTEDTDPARRSYFFDHVKFH